LLVALAGAVLAFAANGISPRGIQLSRDFFFMAGGGPTNATVSPKPTPTLAGTNQPSPAQILAAKLQEEGLHLADSNLVLNLFHDPRCDQDLVIFIDARNEEQYREGHIPRAFNLDYDYPAKHLPTVLPVCDLAQQIVIYCHGGDCEYSLFAAKLLSLRVPKERLLIYGGGITEWETNGLPIEVGERGSGQLRAAK
jgi:rhodanese-related sulfurtransferase